MFWTKNQSEIVWSEMPGIFERHLQRRHNNPLFPVERRTVELQEVKAMRDLDTAYHKEFIKLYTLLILGYNQLTEDVSINDFLKCLRDTQELLELGAQIGGNLTDEISVLEGLENKLTDTLNSKLPDGAAMLEEAQSLSKMQRIPYLAQLGARGGASLLAIESPILKSERLPTLLSEDMESLALLGVISRSSPNSKPNIEDVKKCLEEGVKNGLDTNHASTVLEAWAEK